MVERCAQLPRRQVRPRPQVAVEPTRLAARHRDARGTGVGSLQGSTRARGRWFRRPEPTKDNERSERSELEQLTERARRSEEEVAALRRRLSEGPGRVQTLEERLLETKGQLSQAVSQNEKLTFTLQQAKEHIAALREEVDKLTQPPCAYGTFVAANDDRTVDVFSGGRKMRVAVHPEIDVEEMRRGEEVVLNESLSVILHRKGDESGEVVTLKEVLEGGTRAIVYGRADEERVVELADSLEGVQDPCRRRVAHGAASAAAGREAAPSRGRRARLGGGARHHLRGCRRPRRADRGDHRRGRAALPAPPAVLRVQAAGAEGDPALRASRDAARP